MQGTLQATMQPTQMGTFARFAASVPVDTSNYLDFPIVNAAMKAKTKELFCMDKLVYDFTSSTCRLEKATSLTQQDFGATADGRWDKAAVDAWRGGEAVRLVKLYSQVGTGKEHTYANKPTIITAGGVVVRHGCDWNSTTEQLTRSNTDGAVGIPYSTNIFGETVNSGINLSTGEVHCLFSPNLRKRGQITSQPSALSPSSAAECMWSYTLSSTNFMNSRLCAGGSTQYHTRNGTGAGGTAQNFTGENLGFTLKANMGRVWSVRMDGTNWSRYESTGLQDQVALSAGNITANATFTNGTLRTGRREDTATDYANGLFYCIIVTDLLTDIERTLLHSRITLCAQQHLITPLATIKGYWDEWVDFRNTNPSTGVLVGDKGLLTLNHQTTGSPTFTYNYTVPNLGIAGRRSATNNTSNNYIATNTYFGDQHTGSFFVFGTNETPNATGIMGYWHNDGSASQSNAGTYTLGIGRDHNAPRLLLCASNAKDTARYTEAYGMTDSAGGQISQSMCKYGYKLTNGDWNSEEAVTAAATITAYGLSQAVAIGDLLTTNAHYPSGVDCVIDSVDTTNDAIVSAAADAIALGRGGKVNGARVQFTTTGTLPAPFATTTNYYMRIQGAGTNEGRRTFFATASDAQNNINRIDITTTGTGTHTMRIMAVYNVTTLTGGASAPPTPGNKNYPGYSTALVYPLSGQGVANAGSTQLLIADFAKPASYNLNDPLATREPLMKKATARLYASPFMGAPLGHYDGDIALAEGNASVVHGDGTGVIRNGNTQANNRVGTDIIWGFKAGSNLTFEQKQRFRLNLYKAFV